MLSLQEGLNSAQVNPITPVCNELHLKQLAGDVFISSSAASWIAQPQKNNYFSGVEVGSYPEIFKDKGEFVLCLEVNVRNAQCGNWAKHGTNVAYLGHFPQYLPIDYFFGMRQGESFEIVCKEIGNQFVLTGKQENLEKLVEESFMTAYCELNGKYRNGHLSVDDQKKWHIVDDLKQKHYPHLKLF